MKVLPLVRAEFARLTASRLGIASLIAIMIVPVVYGGLYLWGNEDPYSKLDRVPAALVVDDAGATVNDKAVNYGRDAATQLLSDRKFGWKKVTDAQARAGVTNGTYDFAVTFPATFSADLASATATTPVRATIELRTDDTNSYLSTTIAKQASEAVRVAVAEKVGKAGSRQLLDAVANIRTGLVDARDGAAKLTDGASTLSSGTSDLADGTAAAASGSARLSSGLAQLDAGAAGLPAKTAQLSSGAAQVAAGAKAVKAAAPGAASGARSAAAGAASLAAGLTQLSGSFPAYRGSLASALAASDLPPSVQQQLLGGLDALGTGASQSSAGASALTSGLRTLSSGLSTLPSNADRLYFGASQVAVGTRTLAAATPALASGISSAATSSAKLATGVARLDAGATKVDTGAGKLDAGAKKLSDSLSSGVAKVPATTAAQRADKASQLANPAAVKQHAVTEAENYGAGLAPFFISLAAWIGLYALFLLVRPLSRRALTAVRRPLRTTLAGWLTPAILGAVQMIALFLLVTLALRLQVADGPGLLAFMFLIAITFAAMILALNVLFGSVGQFLALILMIVQLVTAGGTFPWQTLPGPLAFIHQALPMSHAVDGVRELMYGSTASLWGPVSFLLSWLVASLVVAALGASRQGRFRTLVQLRPGAIGG